MDHHAIELSKIEDRKCSLVDDERSRNVVRDRVKLFSDQRSRSTRCND